MKPLELVIYPVVEEIQDGPGIVTKVYDHERGFIYDWRADRLAKSKRLTTSELAAESWRMMSDWQMAHIDQEPTEKYRARCETLHRFATLPSYDEVPE